MWLRERELQGRSPRRLPSLDLKGKSGAKRPVWRVASSEAPSSLRAGNWQPFKRRVANLGPSSAHGPRFGSGDSLTRDHRLDTLRPDRLPAPADHGPSPQIPRTATRPTHPLVELLWERGEARDAKVIARLIGDAPPGGANRAQQRPTRIVPEAGPAFPGRRKPPATFVADCPTNAAQFEGQSISSFLANRIPPIFSTRWRLGRSRSRDRGAR